MRNLIETDDFTPVVSVPENGEHVTAELRDPAFQALANRTRHLKERSDRYASALGGPDGLLEWAYPTPRPRVIRIPASGFVPERFQDPNIRFVFDDADIGGEVRLRLGSDTFASLDLTRIIPAGAVGIVVRVYVTLGGYLSTPGGSAYLVTKELPFGPSIGERRARLLGSRSTAGLHSIGDEHSFSRGPADNKSWELVYKTGTLDVGSYDYIEAAVVSFNDPGPRNF